MLGTKVFFFAFRDFKGKTRSTRHHTALVQMELDEYRAHKPITTLCVVHTAIPMQAVQWEKFNSIDQHRMSRRKRRNDHAWKKAKKNMPCSPNVRTQSVFWFCVPHSFARPSLPLFFFLCDRCSVQCLTTLICSYTPHTTNTKMWNESKIHMLRIWFQWDNHMFTWQGVLSLSHTHTL